MFRVKERIRTWLDVPVTRFVSDTAAQVQTLEETESEHYSDLEDRIDTLEKNNFEDSISDLEQRVEALEDEAKEAASTRWVEEQLEGIIEHIADEKPWDDDLESAIDDVKDQTAETFKGADEKIAALEAKIEKLETILVASGIWDRENDRVRPPL